jgi:uncharacterized protein YndB with AHSA1/START domain
MTPGAVTPLVLRRSYRHPRDRVFDAFASADAIQHWLAPEPDIDTNVLDFDFRVGGHYRIAFKLPSGVETTLSGVFTTIDRPARLCLSWCWEPPDPHAGIESAVLVDFSDHAGTTEVLLSHEMLTGTGMKDRHSGGWQGSFQRLQTWLESTAPPIIQ